MIYSMTGFGKSEANIQDKLVQVEIRTLNSKGFDVNVRMPNYIREKEIEVRNLLRETLHRGKIDVYFSIQLPDRLRAHSIHQGLAKTYAAQIREMHEEIGGDVNNISELVLKMPGVLEIPEEDIDEKEWSGIRSVLVEAIKRVEEFRQVEGEKTEVVVEGALNTILENLNEIPKFEQERIETIRQRISKNLETLVDHVDLDKNRFEQELIFYIEKFDLSEEKMRLAAHIEHFKGLLAQKDMNSKTKGKKLGFISQEIGREVNTIGSKANHAEIQKHVVVMKDYLEQIKEQLANIL